MVYYPYFPQNAIKIHDTTVVQNLEDVDRSVTQRDIAEKLEAIRTLPSKYHPSRFDIGPLGRDETWMEFVKWRMVGEEDQTVEYFRAPESVGIMIPVKGKYHPANIAGTTINDSIINLNMRDVGKYLSLEYNFREHLMDYMKSNEGQQLAASLNKLGYRAEDIDYIAVGFVPERAIYAIGRLSNGKVVIYANNDSDKKIANEAKEFGMKEEELREAAIGEEFNHNFRRSYNRSVGRINEEKATKTMLKEFYETLAKTTSNPKLKAKYARIIEHLEHDISTVSRYAKVYSNSLQDLVDLYCTDMGELESLLEANALYEGINTEKGISEYVSNKFREVAKAAEKEHSGDKAAEESLDVKLSDSEKAESGGGKGGENGEAEVCAEAETGGSESSESGE